MQKILGERIKEIRKSRKMTQAELAEFINVDSKYISRIETSNGSPSLELLEKIACALKVEIKDLFDVSHIKTKDCLDLEIKRMLPLLNNKDTATIFHLVRFLSLASLRALE